MTYYFTSITANYFAKARVLCKTLKEFNPEVFFVLVITGCLPEGIELEQEPFDYVIPADSLSGIDNRDIFFFMHSITEICTAVKPMAALEIIHRYHATKVVYLDPDIAVFSSLQELDQLLDDYSMLFTPHQLKPEDDDSYVKSNEILFLKRGTYNLGFFAVKADEEGIRFLTWWKDRLLHYCFDDDYKLIDALERDGLLGMFTDQKWIDLVPAFFDRYYILKDPGYNVSTWNMTHRVLTRGGDGKTKVNGKPLRFFHFSGFDSQGHHNEMQRAIEYNNDNRDAVQLSKWYEAALLDSEQKKFERIPGPYAHYSDGTRIDSKDRKLLHIRKDVHQYFPDPFKIVEGTCFFSWVRKEYAQYYIERCERRADGVSPAGSMIESFVRSNMMKRVNKILFPPFSERRRWAKRVYDRVRRPQRSFL